MILREKSYRSNLLADYVAREFWYALLLCIYISVMIQLRSYLDPGFELIIDT
jgi:hypothetical protein